MKQISRIANSANASPATISKVLNHCYGVSGDVRERIYREYDRVSCGKAESGHVNIYVIIPEIPSFFWNLELERFRNDWVTVKYNVYSRLGDHEIVMRYLKEAVACDADVIVIAAKLNGESEKLLSELADKKLIIFLTEYHDLVNCFYVGSDPGADGMRLADACLRRPDIRKVLVLQENYPDQGKTSAIRLESFCGALQGRVAYDVVDVKVQVGVAMLPSTVARAIAPFLKTNAYDAVVAMNGYVPEVCAAVQKMKLPRTVRCFGFEKSPQIHKWAEKGYLKAVIWQDFARQFSAAMAIAEHYIETRQCPQKKYTFLPSGLVEYP